MSEIIVDKILNYGLAGIVIVYIGYKIDKLSHEINQLTLFLKSK